MAEVPLGVVTVTSASPAALVGGKTAIEVSERTMNVAGLEPKSTAVAPVKPDPVIITVFPPLAGPKFGLIDVIVGAPNATLAWRMIKKKNLFNRV